jgi:hypothetical protein
MSNIIVDSITMAMFTKVFAIKMVASNFLGYSSKYFEHDAVLEIPSVNSSICSFVNEKKAFSLLDIIAEHAISIAMQTIQITTVTTSPELMAGFMIDKKNK